MLIMSARKFGDPVFELVKMEACYALIHSRIAF